MGTAARTIASFVAGLRATDIPPGAREAAKRHLADALGVALAASSRGEGTTAADMARSWAGAREAAVLGHDFRAPAAHAAFANGVLARALDFDDTHVESVVHPSAVVMPAALAVGEEVGATGEEVLTAAIAGYEVAARVGAAAPGRFHQRGLHTTGIAGPFAAAAVAARLWTLGAEETAHALGIAAGRAAGLLGSPLEDADSRMMHAGWAAQAGIIAADLARRGATGPATVFEGPNGLFDALLAGEEPDRDRLVAGLGATWEVTRIALKPYPASHFLHAAMDAASGVGMKWADVEEIVCGIPPAAIPIVAEPRAPRLHPGSTAAARSSLPFAVASAVVGGREGLALFGEEARADRRVLTLAERVHHRADATLAFPAAFGARVRLSTRSGRSFEVDEPINRGHPDRPLPRETFEEKFLGNARARIGSSAAASLLAAVSALEAQPDLTGIAELVTVG